MCCPSKGAWEMETTYAVLATDGVNRMRMLLPLSTLVDSIESQVERCHETGVEIGLPMNLGHDRCRSIGWCRSNAVLVTKDCGRPVGLVYFPEPFEIVFRHWLRIWRAPWIGRVVRSRTDG